MLVACGPFTLSDDLEFAPLVELIQQINAIRPHLVFILGPFVDVRNKKIETGDLDYTYQEQFDIVIKELQTKISKYVHLKKYRAETNNVLYVMENCFIGSTVQVCIVPSWRDVHFRTVYPTPPFQQESKVPNFHFFSDPCVLNVNGVFIGLTSTDILFHLSKEEIAV